VGCKNKEIAAIAVIARHRRDREFQITAIDGTH
jgi:hypothetical protein